MLTYVRMGAVAPVVWCALAIGTTTSAQNEPVRPPIASPFGTVLHDTGIQPVRGWHAPRGTIVDLQAAADHIVAQQCINGGWGWPHDDCSATPNNITAPIATGVMRAYRATQDPAHIASVIAGGDFDLLYQYGNGSPRFSAFTPWFLNELSKETGDTAYSDHAAIGFFGALDAGVYGSAADWDTADWIALVQAGRVGAWVNLRPWDLHLMIPTADELGTPTQASQFIDAVLDGLDTLDGTDPGGVYYDTLGIAGATRGLSLGGVTSFPAINSPLHPLINGIDNLSDLVSVLVSLQNPDGSWDWHSNLATPDNTDKDTQTTAYAVLALIAAQQAGAGSYAAEIALGRQWIGSMQTIDGGFLSYPTGDENTEVEGEATTALASMSSLSLNTNLCENTGTLIVTIDMSDTAVEIVGGQFFLTFDDSALTFVSAVPGGGTFTTEVFEMVVGDEINYAVGVPLGGTGTTVGETMAVLEFTINGENCTPEDGLVAFRSSVPPTRLTDELGNPVLTELIDLNEVSFDQTPPSITPPGDITVNADAGGCDATLDYNEPFDDTVLTSSTQAPGVWYTDRYPPAVFENAFFDGDNRLHHGVRTADTQANRPSGFSGPFYNYQGRKYVVGAQAHTTASIDIYVDSTWLPGTRAGMWTTMSNGNLTFPIIEYTVDGDNGDGNGPTYTGFRYWQSGIGWTATTFANAPTDQWYTLEIELTATDVLFSINGTPIATEGNLGALTIENVILNVHNEGPAGEYDVYWDNFNTGAPGAVATDNCSAVTVTFERSDNPLLGFGDPFPAGVTTVTWTATDACGNSASDVQFVTVNAVNDLAVEVELANVDPGPFDRCITFELSPTGGGAPIVVEETMTFTGGLASAVIQIPCGDYDCITARDTLHTLASRDDDDFGVSGSGYVADFTSGDALRGGNFNDDPFIDILDFGIFIGQFGLTLGADTPCGTPGPHADASGDGEVGLADFTFIQTQFLAMSETPCGVGPAPATGNPGMMAITPSRIDGPTASITVDELERRGLGHLAVGDLNGDGVLDSADIAAFFGGARPDHLADVDGDGVVTPMDLYIVKTALIENDPAGDVNRDGRLDLADILFVAQRLGLVIER